MHNKLIKNKRAQTGDTITWLVATVVIVVVLSISIFAASIFFDKNKLLSSQYFKSSDTLASKSLFSYVLTKDSNGGVVYQQLKTEENLNAFNGNLSKKIFINLYEKEYLTIWLGLVEDIKGPLGISKSNDFFGTIRIKDSDKIIAEEIKLLGDKSVRMVLSKFVYTK